MYENSGQLLLALGQLLTNFKAYSAVPKVADIISTVARIKSMYYDKIMREFESLTELGVAEAMGGEGRDTAAQTSLKQACEVVDALDVGARDGLIRTFCLYGQCLCGRGSSFDACLSPSSFPSLLSAPQEAAAAV